MSNKWVDFSWPGSEPTNVRIEQTGTETTLLSNLLVLLRDILASDGTEAINIFFLLHLGFFSIEGERDKKKKAKKEYYDV